MAEGRPPALIPSSQPAQCREFGTPHSIRLTAYGGAALSHAVAVPSEVLTFFYLASRCG
jgi:hypothetical protein